MFVAAQTEKSRPGNLVAEVQRMVLLLHGRHLSRELF
jgi:hypothetical protein